MTLFITLGDILSIIGFVLAILFLLALWWSTK